jgi:hypothetical protein
LFGQKVPLAVSELTATAESLAPLVGLDPDQTLAYLTEFVRS